MKMFNQISLTEDLLIGRASSNSLFTTNLCLTDKGDFFSFIIKSLAHSISLQSSLLTDLVLICPGPEGPLPVSVHSTVLAGHSPILRDLLHSVTSPVLLLPDVEVETVWNMLGLLYTGRCELKAEAAVSSLMQLLASLGMDTVVGSLVFDKKLEEGKECSDINRGVNVAREQNSAKLGRKRRKKVLRNYITDAKVTSVEAVCNDLDNTKSEKKKFPGRFCQVCGKREKNLYTLKVHYTNNHFFSEVAALVSDKDSSQCELCGQNFADCENRFCNIVRHRGATHKEVMKFVQKHCGSGDLLTYDECKICGVKREQWEPESLGHHLIEEHFYLKLKELLSPEQDVCHLCNSKYKDIYGMIAHIGLTHGGAMKLYREFLEPSQNRQSMNVKGGKKSRRNFKFKTEYKLITSSPKLSKNCHLCHIDIAASGIYWRFPLYSHYARIHFGENLVRDFRTEDNKCSQCGAAEDSMGERLFLVHLGAKHRLVEKYFDNNLLKGFKETEEQEKLSVSANHGVKENFMMHDAFSIVNKRKYLSTVEQENGLESPTLIKDHSPTDSDLEEENTEVLLKEMNQLLADIEPGKSVRKAASSPVNLNKKVSPDRQALVPLVKCPHCDKRVQERSLQTHLLSKHFRKETEEAIKTILVKTDGKCPKCPAKLKWSQSLAVVDWSVHIHFARSHKICENLVPGGGDKVFQDNIEKMVGKLSD